MMTSLSTQATPTVDLTIVRPTALLTFGTGIIAAAVALASAPLRLTGRPAERPTVDSVVAG